MKNPAFDPEKLIDVMSEFLNVPVEQAFRPGVAQHLQSAQEIAASLLALPLDDEAEPGPVFKA